VQLENKKIRIALVDDHQMFREGLKFVLSDIANAEVVSESSNGAEFLDCLDALQPDLILMDIAMPEMDGIEATKRALARYPGLKIIALSMFGEEAYYTKMMNAGVSGFIIKESGAEELEVAIKEVASGGTYFSQKLLQNIVIKKTTATERRIPEEIVKISQREQEVLKLICSGSSNTDIAGKLGISLRTVEGHRSNMINRTGVKNSIQLVLYAHKNRLFSIQ
jgi:DNA-binding NarL/FixJ family response regulator